jgi:hypothetical protein
MFTTILASFATHGSMTFSEAQREVFKAFKAAFLFWGAIPIWLILICFMIVWTRNKYHG